MKEIKTVIVDDEPAAVDVIRALLKQFGPEFKVVGVAQSGLSAVQLITEAEPELVFLDVDMPLMNGLQVLEKIPSVSFGIIFTTGSTAYAINAIKRNAIDYLLKPIDPADFIIAMDKARKHHNLKHLAATNISRKLQLPTQNETIFLDESEIMHIVGMGSYCQINTVSHDKIVISKNIGQFEEKLTPGQFFRCHNSNIINLNFVSKFLHKEKQFMVELKDGTHVEVSRRNKDKLLQIFSGRIK